MKMFLSYVALLVIALYIIGLPVVVSSIDYIFALILPPLTPILAVIFTFRAEYGLWFMCALPVLVIVLMHSRRET